MRLSFLSIITLLLFSATPSLTKADLLIYEGFDYAPGNNIDTVTSTGIGLSGNWTVTNAAGNNPHSVGSGLSFGDLIVSGGSIERDIRDGRSTTSRTVTASPLLTADNTSIYFSVLMDPTINSNGFLQGEGQFGNTYATLIFGNEELTDSGNGNNGGNGTIANNGDGVGVGFFGPPLFSTLGFSGVGIQGVTFTNGTSNQSDRQTSSIVTGDALSLIVGRIDWAANGSSDTISLFNITDPTAPLGTAFSSQVLDVDQTTFDTISITDGQTSAFDEIRFGTTLADVLPVAVPEPTSTSLLYLGSLAFFRRRRT